MHTYTLILKDADLRHMAAEMKAVATKSRLDPDNLPKEIYDEPGEKIKVGPLLRIHGPHMGEFIAKYSRFITLSVADPKPLQVSYMEYEVDGVESIVCQLTIVNNKRETLDPKDISRLTHFFFDPDKIFRMEGTEVAPPFVSIQLQRISRDA